VRLSENQEESIKLRAAVYIDGFNLYHPIHEMNEPFLKWACLWQLSEILCSPLNYQLQKVVFCTAVPLDNAGKRDRHNTFNSAQIARGVQIIKGHHVWDATSQKHSEKQSDINVALSLILDAVDNVYDAAFLISADSDQAATARVFSERFPDKKLYSVAPPDRSPPSKSASYCAKSFSLRKDQIEACVMPAMVKTVTGAWIRRPAEYVPPTWWVHPKDRPKKK
jgi:uncharacterized LabA/DUF88 family protein